MTEIESSMSDRGHKSRHYKKCPTFALFTHIFITLTLKSGAKHVVHMTLKTRPLCDRPVTSYSQSYVDCMECLVPV